MKFKAAPCPLFPLLFLRSRHSPRRLVRTRFNFAGQNQPHLNPGPSWDVVNMEHPPQPGQPVTEPLMEAKEDRAIKRDEFVGNLFEEGKQTREMLTSLMDRMERMEAAAKEKDVESLRKEAAAKKKDVDSLRKEVLVWRRLVATFEFLVAQKDVIELHESIDRCLRGYNDLIFDVKRVSSDDRPLVIQPSDKETLKDDEVEYITHLFKKLPNNKQSLRFARDAALDILTPGERNLCQVLVEARGEGREERNAFQHLQPDVATATKRLEVLFPQSPELYTILQNFLKLDPSRMRGDNEAGKPDVHFKLFARPGTYQPVEAMKEALTRDRSMLADLEQQLAKEEAIEAAEAAAAAKKEASKEQ
ncbi:hypothetical protein MSAN_02436100 [Mycena sanguinolenta]|uniref:Uncharacterized protein n=1 Tax=Mycena sanguinolenta TaxID=230812 RepID=A0A8H6WZ06_9AGAR|nr:hypothetical protein MSAN_02436100 [Mycena sanguinolenta]